MEWLKTNAQMEDELFHLEDHTLLKGCIAVINLDNHRNFEKFRLLFNVCEKDLINRALLTIGDYSQFIGWRWQIGAKNESVWIDLFHPTKQRQRFDETTKTLNALLSKPYELSITNENLEQLINEYLNNPDTQKDWRYYFVKYSQMRQGNFGMYYWKDWQNRSKESYEIIMMNTEKSIGGRNWNIFLLALFHLPDFANKLTLGDYAYQGDKLKIKNTDIEIDCLTDKFVVYQNEIQTEYPILQSNGIDTEDRLEKGRQIINECLNETL